MSRIAALAVATLAALVACSGAKDTGSGLDCDAMAAVSASVTVLEAGGGALPQSAEPTVSYTSDAGSSGACDPVAGVWLCGYEVAGAMQITADAWGYAAHTETLTIAQDRCHVVGQSVTVELDPIDCTQEVVPSVVVTVSDSAGESIAGAEVGYCPTDMDCAEPIACEPWDDGYACGWEQAGELGIDVGAPGFMPQYHRVTVTEDECHVITERLDAVLDPA
jgi:hypothetical protein